MNPSSELRWRWLRYAFSLTIPVSAAASFLLEGLWSFAAIAYAFVLLPMLELVLKPNGRNLSPSESAAIQEDGRFDAWLGSMVFIQWGGLIWFWVMMDGAELDGATWWGRVTAMGLLCGVLGINVAHELGHRPHRLASLASYALLVTSLYAHFQVEHNRGHHRNVATDEDPATARRGEWVWLFWVKSWWGGWWHAWQLEAERLRRAGMPFWSWGNEVLRWQAIQGAVLVAVGVIWGWDVAGAWVVAATIGGLLLETVNYIEHYGLSRARVNEHRYERVRAVHSWNSNHPLGRVVLFELSRHSDHHAAPAKPYPQLDHLPDAPQLPTGYPGMMVLSWLPPLYFAVVHPRLKRLEGSGG